MQYSFIYTHFRCHEIPLSNHNNNNKIRFLKINKSIESKENFKLKYSRKLKIKILIYLNKKNLI